MNKREKITITRSAMPPIEEYMAMIEPLWNTRIITNMGAYHYQLEDTLKEYLGVDKLSLMVNGHMALELVIQAMDFGEGSEVITTPFTFISTTHAIVRNRLNPVFCDIKLDDYTIDENKIEELITEKTVAILPVHVYGNICNVDKISKIASKYNLKVIYDAAHAFGETYEQKPVGTFGDASVFSFHATKVFNTIEGGAVAFSSPELYKRLYNLKNFGIQSEEDITEVGANAKMNEFCAAMGLCNMKYLDQNIKRRKEICQHYKQMLKNFKGMVLPVYHENIEYSYSYFPVLIKPEICGVGARDMLYSRLREANIYARKYFYPLTSDVECFQNKYCDAILTNAKYVSDNILALPLYPDLPIEIIEEVVSCIQQMFTR